jgi:hypothetical protein
MKTMLPALRKALPLLLLAIASGSAMADWVAVGSSKTDTLYVDPATIRGTDNRTKMWALNDYQVTQRLDNREPFKSEKAEYEYDCRQAQARLLYFTSHAESMAEGEVVDFNVVPGEWVPVSPKSELEVLWKIACGKA